MRKRLHIITSLAGLAVAAMSACLITATDVMAQDTGTGGGLGGLLPLVLDHVAEIALAGMFGLALTASRWLKAKFDIDTEAALRDIESRHREALHWAIITGLKAALRRMGVRDARELSADMRDQAIAKATRWVIGKGAPEAVDHFELDPDSLAEMALSKLDGET